MKKKNESYLSAEQVQAKADEINREFGRFDTEKIYVPQTEQKDIRSGFGKSGITAG